MRKRAYKTRNESYAGRRLAKLTRGCGMRHEGGMAMQIYSKVERALGSIHILRLVLLFLRVPPIFSLRLFLALPGEGARGFAGTLGSPRKTANYAAENSATRTIRSGRPLRSRRRGALCGAIGRALSNLELGTGVGRASRTYRRGISRESGA